MSIRPSDLLAQAEELAALAETLPDIPRRDGLCRTAVGRAYYAVYHHALAHARRQGFDGSLPGYGSHEGLWDGWSAERGEIEIATAGTSLKRDRHRADYRLRETFSPSFAKATVVIAARTLARIDAR